MRFFCNLVNGGNLFDLKGEEEDAELSLVGGDSVVQRGVRGFVFMVCCVRTV